MIYLILTILFSSFIYIIFKKFDDFKVNTSLAIMVNYWVCALMGALFSKATSPIEMITSVQTALPFAIGLGCLFILVFNFIAKTSQTFGVGIASISDRLSLIIPVIASFILYNDSASVFKILGIALSLVAIVFSVSLNGQSNRNQKLWYFPVIVFFGGGTIGTVLKYVQNSFPDIDFNRFLLFLFGVAGSIGLLLFFVQLIQKKNHFAWKSVLAGIALGIPNYFSMFFFMKALDHPTWESSLIFPLNNIGIMTASTIAGILLFKEQFNTKQRIGFALSLLAITLLILDVR